MNHGIMNKVTVVGHQISRGRNSHSPIIEEFGVTSDDHCHFGVFRLVTAAEIDHPDWSWLPIPSTPDGLPLRGRRGRRDPKQPKPQQFGTATAALDWLNHELGRGRMRPGEDTVFTPGPVPASAIPQPPPTTKVVQESLL